MNHRQPRLHRDSKQLASSYFNRAANLYQQACYAQAIQYYLEGLKIAPTWVEVHADLAKAYEMLGCWNQALESLEIALRLRPGYPTALRRKQRILEEKSVYDDLIDELDLAPDTSDTQLSPQHQPANSVASVPSKIEREFFTLTCAHTIPDKLLSVVCQLVEHTYHGVGKMLQCYPQHKVPVFMEVINQSDTLKAVNPTGGAKYSIGVAANTSSSDPSLPLWAIACYDNGDIRLVYRPYSDSGIGVLYAVIRHEWTHLLVDLLTGGRCPNWLDEGLAQFMARPLMNSEKEFLQQASRDRHFLPLHILRKPFSHLPDRQRRLAYLQSHAIAEYLIQQFSFSDLRDFLRRIGDGKSPDIAFREIFRKTEEEIVVAWSVEESRR